jgi:hypothetical protein
VLLRTVDYSAPVWTQPDPDVGWTLRPQLREVNVHGVRDRQRNMAKPDEVYRIAVLGDEYSEARQLPIARTWWMRLGPELEACGFQPRKRIEVMSFAVGGFGTAQQYAQLQTKAMRYQPDLVLLQFNNANDVRNNSFILDPEKDRPFYMFDAKGRLVLDDSFATAPDFRKGTSFRSEMLRRLTDKARTLQLARSMRDWQPVASAQAFDAQAAAFGAPRDVIWEEAWHITEALIGKSRDFAARNGTQLALVIVPDKSQLINPDDWYAEKRLQTLSRKLGMTAIALEGDMQRRGSLEALFEQKEGHQAAAEIVARQLCERGS